ncbi:hypothetical protein FGB62_186g023 [Gracilaria domingensis]|nr:hypothetical protein FGB62_186g023 [Gracilaria domingensis]
MHTASKMSVMRNAARNSCLYGLGRTVLTGEWSWFPVFFPCVNYKGGEQEEVGGEVGVGLGFEGFVALGLSHASECSHSTSPAMEIPRVAYERVLEASQQSLRWAW